MFRLRRRAQRPPSRMGIARLRNAPWSALAMLNIEHLRKQAKLYVRDIVTACDFYSRMLGFSVAFTYGKPPFYGQVFRDGVRLNLRQVDTPVVERRDAEQLLAASITLEDAKPLFLEYQSAGVE